MDAGYAWKLSKFGRLTSTRLRFDDDFSDRLNYQFTGLLLFIFIGIIGIRQYTGKPIQCWTPQEFTRGWEEYAENYCWVASTFFVRSWVNQNDNKIPNHSSVNGGRGDNVNTNLNQQKNPILYQTLEKPNHQDSSYINRNDKYNKRYLPSETEKQQKNPSMQLVQVENTKVNLRSMLSYYQWAPILLAIQALFFYIPCLMWRLFSSRSGLHLKRIMQLASEANQAVPTEAEVNQADVEAAKVVLNRSDSLGSLTKPKQVQQTFNSSKAIKTLARYIDACLQRQIDLRSVKKRQKFYSSMYNAREKKKKQLNTYRFNNNICENFCCFFKRCCYSVSNQRKSKHQHLTKVSPKAGDLAEEKITSNDRPRMNDNFEKAGCSICSCDCFSSGSWLVGLYFFMKILYLLNVIGQMYLMEVYTGVKYNLYGLRVLYDLACGVEWEQSGHFPRVTFCEFEAVKFSVNYRYVLQCVLPMNMFLEKIYIFLWLWFLLIGMLTFSTLIYWVSRVGTKKCRFTWIHNQLLTLRVQHPSLVITMAFIEEYLGPDGVFLLKLISTNYGELIVGDLIGELWFLHKQRKMAIHRFTPQTNVNVVKPPPVVSKKPPIRRTPQGKKLSDTSVLKPSPKKPLYSKKLLANFKPGQKVSLETILKAHQMMKGDIPANLLSSGKDPTADPLAAAKTGVKFENPGKMTVIGIDVAANRDQLRHPAEWLAMLNAQAAGAEFGGSSASSSSGQNQHFRGNMDLRNATSATVNQGVNQRNQSPPPIPSRNIESRASNSGSGYASDQFDPDRTQALDYQADIDQVANYFDDINHNNLDVYDEKELGQDNDFQYMPVEQEFQQIGEVNYNDMNIQDGTGLDGMNDNMQDDMGGMAGPDEDDDFGNDMGEIGGLDFGGNDDMDRMDEFDRDDGMNNDDFDDDRGAGGMDDHIV